MSLAALLVTAGALGVAGGVHCIAMCSVAQRVAVHGLEARGFGPDLSFQLGRISAYALLGAVAGAGSEVLRLGAEQLPLMRPLWATLNAALLTLGLWLLVAGQQPGVLKLLGDRVWHRLGPHRPVLARFAVAGAGSSFDAKPREPSCRTRTVLLGAAWALLPCGLLYSALAVAVLASGPVEGALVMLTFAAGTALNLLIAQRLWHWLALRRAAGTSQRIERAGVRIGGALLATMAAVALVAIALGQPHPFCLP